MGRKLSVQSLADATLAAAAVVLVSWVIARDSRASGRGDAARAIEPYAVEGWESARLVGTEIGKSDGEIQVVEFLDLECAACASYHSSVAKGLLGRREPPFVSWVVVHFPLKSHANAREAARAAECARRGGKFGEFIDAAFSTHAAVADRRWSELATAAGVVDTDEFAACLGTESASAPADSGRALGDRLGINATPTLIVNGRRFPSPPSGERVLAEVTSQSRVSSVSP
jgi:protein-disulfide isomerase